MAPQPPFAAPQRIIGRSGKQTFVARGEAARCDGHLIAGIAFLTKQHLSIIERVVR